KRRAGAKNASKEIDQNRNASDRIQVQGRIIVLVFVYSLVVSLLENLLFVIFVYMYEYEWSKNDNKLISLRARSLFVVGCIALSQSPIIFWNLYEEIELIKTLVCVPSIILVYLHTLPLVSVLSVLLTRMPHDSRPYCIGTKTGYENRQTQKKNISAYSHLNSGGICNFYCAYFYNNGLHVGFIFSSYD
ncbi:hypothetical protein ACJX0J_024264, partial [Zea mays]